MIISERIFSLIEERKFSLTEFSRKTGISQSTISDWKRKKTNPSADKILIICDVLDVNPYELLQDSHRTEEGTGIDYIIISEGTDKYRLVLEFEKLTPGKRERVFGYISALQE